MTTLQIEAYHEMGQYDYDAGKYVSSHPEQPTIIRARFLDVVDAAAVDAAFPKSTKATVRGGFHVALTSNKTTGDKNEGGLKRYVSLLKNARKAGFAIEYLVTRSVNTYPSLEAFHAAIGVEG